jgi:hypothetical protein
LAAEVQRRRLALGLHGSLLHRRKRWGVKVPGVVRGDAEHGQAVSHVHVLGKDRLVRPALQAQEENKPRAIC